MDLTTGTRNGLGLFGLTKERELILMEGRGRKGKRWEGFNLILCLVERRGGGSLSLFGSGEI